jgi:diaminopimelate epimerase
MQSAGNDYIYFDCLEKELENPEKVAKTLSKRHFSVGSDGIVLICRSQIADAKMRIFNSDGSEAKMCGNAARCVGKLLFESNFARKSHLTLETESGIYHIYLTVRDGKVEKITVDMGTAQLGEMYNLEVAGQKYEMRNINVGNEHQVAIVPDVDFPNFERIGIACEKNPRFEEGINTEFCEIVDKNHLKVRVFERGSGETLACGTGACACAVVGVAIGVCEFNRAIRVEMRGGELVVICDENFNVRLMGDAQTTFYGEVDV